LPPWLRTVHCAASDEVPCPAGAMLPRGRVRVSAASAGVMPHGMPLCAPEPLCAVLTLTLILASRPTTLCRRNACDLGLVDREPRRLVKLALAEMLLEPLDTRLRVQKVLLVKRAAG